MKNKTSLRRPLRNLFWVSWGRHFWILHERVLSSDGTGQWTSSNIIRTTNKGKTGGEKIPEHPNPYRQRSMKTHKRWQKLGNKPWKREEIKRPFMFGILFVMIIYVKNKFQPIIVFAIFCLKRNRSRNRNTSNSLLVFMRLALGGHSRIGCSN